MWQFNGFTTGGPKFGFKSTSPLGDINGINRIIVGRHVNHAMSRSLKVAGRDVHIGHHQRLRLYLVVQDNRLQYSER